MRNGSRKCRGAGVSVVPLSPSPASAVSSPICSHVVIWPYTTMQRCPSW